MVARYHSEIDPQFGARLRRCREARGMSQAELARRAGVAQSIVSGYECGKQMPAYETLRAVARELDVEPQELTRETHLKGWMSHALIHEDWHDCTTEDIARALGVDVNQIQPMLSYCRDALGVEVQYRLSRGGRKSHDARHEPPERDLPSHGKSVGLWQCRDCGYRCRTGSGLVCQYILVTGHLRPAPVDGICYCKVQSTKPFPCTATNSPVENGMAKRRGHGGRKKREKVMRDAEE